MSNKQIHTAQHVVCQLACCDNAVDDLQHSAHEVSIHSVLCSQLARRGEGGGSQEGSGCQGGLSRRGATAPGPPTYPLVPV